MSNMFPVVTLEDIQKLENVKNDIDNIIECVFAELFDDNFSISKNTHHKTRSLTIDVFIGLENKSSFKISQIQSKVLTLVELMKRRYDAKIIYRTSSKSQSQEIFFKQFPFFKYDTIKNFKVSIMIK